MSAEIARAGMDPMEFLTTDDVVQAMVMTKIARRFHENLRDEQQSLAVAIINALAKSMRK